MKRWHLWLLKIFLLRGLNDVSELLVRFSQLAERKTHFRFPNEPN